MAGARHEGEDVELASLLIDSVVDYALFVLDAHGGVRSWNPGAERLKGYRADEIIGRDLSVFYTPEDREAGLPARLLAQAAEQGRVIHTGWRVRKDGTRFYGDVTITALRGDDGELRGFAKVTRDRTDQHEADLAMSRALERERQAAHELSRLEETRAQFLAAVSHDLKAPLGAIHGGLGLLLDTELEDRDRLLAMIQRNLERLLTMATQLSELARLERGSLELERKPVSLAELVDTCVVSLETTMEDTEVHTDVDATVEADPTALERMVVNLLTNAVRYSPPGAPVTVTSGLTASGTVLAVEDEGPGVPPEERERIFREFRQGVRRHRDGLGLGLSIVRHYAEAHGGRAWVEDGERGGARFCVLLPHAPPSA